MTTTRTRARPQPSPCTRPLTKTFNKYLNQFIKEVPVRGSRIRFKVEKIMANMGTGPWCRALTQMIATVTRKWEE